MAIFLLAGSDSVFMALELCGYEDNMGAQGMHSAMIPGMPRTCLMVPESVIQPWRLMVLTANTVGFHVGTKRALNYTSASTTFNDSCIIDSYFSPLLGSDSWKYEIPNKQVYTTTVAMSPID